MDHGKGGVRWPIQSVHRLPFRLCFAPSPPFVAWSLPWSLSGKLGSPLPRRAACPYDRDGTTRIDSPWCGASRLRKTAVSRGKRMQQHQTGGELTN